MPVVSGEPPAVEAVVHAHAETKSCSYRLLGSASACLEGNGCFAPAGLEAKLADIAARRKLEDLSIGPVLTWTTRAMLDHVDKLLQIPGAGCCIVLL